MENYKTVVIERSTDKTGGLRRGLYGGPGSSLAGSAGGQRFTEARDQEYNNFKEVECGGYGYSLIIICLHQRPG